MPFSLKTLRFAIFLLFIGVVLVGCNRQDANGELVDEKIKKQVHVQTIIPQDEVVTNLTVSGTVVPKQYSVIRSLTPGTVEFLAPVGSTITVGQPLFSIEDTNIESNYFNSLQSFQQTNVVTQQRVSQAGLNVNSAQARRDLAANNLETTRRQTVQALTASQNSAVVTYQSAYNVMSQTFNFLSVGSINNFSFRYKNIATPQTQLRIDTEAQYNTVATNFLGLSSQPDATHLVSSLAALHNSLNATKGLVDLTVLLLQNALGLGAGVEGSVSSDQVVIAGYQTQLNQLVDSVITVSNALENTAINNQLILDQAANQLELAEIELNNAIVALDNARESAELEKTVSRSQLDNATYNYNNLTLRSPFSGTILSHFIKVGEQTQTGQQLIELGNLSIVEISVAVDADFGAGLKQGDPVIIDSSHQGFISQIEPVGNISSGKVGVTVQSQNASNGLTAGDVADVSFNLVYRQTNLIVIPIKSASIEATGTTVFVVEDGVVKKRTVTLGKIFGDRVSVESGLAEGDYVILVDGVFVAEGDEVEVAN